MIRELLVRGSEVATHPDGSRTYTYQIDDDQFAALRRRMDDAAERASADGLASCLVALADEARSIQLTEAAWAIELAVQLIGIHSEVPIRSHG